MTAILEQSRIRAGRWEGVIRAAAPQIEVLHDGFALPGLELGARVDDRQSVSVPIPAALLNDGVQTLVIRDAGVVIGHLSIITGVPMEDDLRAELDLMRAELDLLKAAFRKHCAAG